MGVCKLEVREQRLTAIQNGTFRSYLFRPKGFRSWAGRIAWVFLALWWLLFPDTLEDSRRSFVLKAAIGLWPVWSIAYQFAVFRGWCQPKVKEPWKEF